MIRGKFSNKENLPLSYFSKLVLLFLKERDKTINRLFICFNNFILVFALFTCGFDTSSEKDLKIHATIN
jgi:hypothetical protein